MMRKTFYGILSLAALCLATSAQAQSQQCTVPHTLTNGQVADASEVMDNFNAVAACVDNARGDAVTHEGTPATGAIAVFASPTGITGGDLTGDVSTAGGIVTELAPSGVTPGTYTSANITVDAKGRVTAAGSGSGSGGSGPPMALPSAAAFSNVLNAPTISDGLYSFRLSTTGNTGLQGVYNGAPALPFSAVLKVRGGVLTNFNSMGFIVGDSSGRFVTVNIVSVNNVLTAIEQWNSFNSFASGLASTNMVRSDIPQWLKVDVDANGDVAGYWSFTGDNWVQIGTARSTWLGAVDKVGIAVNRNSTTNLHAFFESYEIE